MPQPTDPTKLSHMFTDDIKFTQKIVLFHPLETDKFLVLRRSASAVVRPGALDLPGGNVSFGENALDALFREIKEETSIEGEFDTEVVHLTAIMRESKGYYLFAVGYKSSLNISQLNQLKLSDEHSEISWMTKKEFLDYDHHWFLRQFVEKI